MVAGKEKVSRIAWGLIIYQLETVNVTKLLQMQVPRPLHSVALEWAGNLHFLMNVLRVMYKLWKHRDSSVGTNLTNHLIS